jgi:hypothetical protein
MTRHASADELALLDAGELRRRKAAKVTAHVVSCTQCTEVRAELAGLSTVLAAAPYPPLPQTVSVRIEASLRVEASQRLAAAPATEAGRRELPVRSRGQRASAGQRGWQFPGLSVAATRLASAAGAVAVIGAGAYLVASNLPSGAPASSSSSAALPSNQPMSAGPPVTYGSPGSQHTIHTVSSATNFVPAQLRDQVLGAYHEAQLKGEAGTQSGGAASAPAAKLSPLQSSAAGGTSTGSGLAGCLDAVGAGRSVLLLDLAKYQNKPATIIVLGGTATSQAEVVVTGRTCSATAPDVLTRVPLGHL